MSNVVIDIITQFTGKKAFKDAETATAKLTSGVKKLAGAFGVAFSARAIVQFSRASITAFAEAEKANIRLANSVKNIGLAYATADIQKNLDEISAKTGIAGEPLAAAFQSLLTTTGSVIESQKLFNQALDISAGTGIQLGTVTQDLANGYVGITKGLKKYNLGLSQAQLKSKSFAEISQLLNDQFSGANARYLKTYAGQMAILGEAAGNAQEIIGQSLIDSLKLLSGDQSVENLADEMADLATFTGDVIYGLGILTDKLNNLPGAKQVGGIGKLLELFPLTGIPIIAAQNLAELARSDKAAKNAFNFASGGGAGTGSTAKIAATQAAKAEAAAKKRQQDRLKAEKAAAKLAKDQLALKKAGTIFDLEQTQILAALKGKITDDERKRLELQLAITTGNVNEASKLAYELAKSQGLTEQLARYLADFPDANNPFKAWSSYLDMIEERLKKLNLTPPSGTTGTITQPAPIITGSVPYDPRTGNMPDIAGLTGKQQFERGLSGGLYGSTPVVNVQVTLDGQELTGAVTKTQTNNYLSGKIIALERTQSSFL